MKYILFRRVTKDGEDRIIEIHFSDDPTTGQTAEELLNLHLQRNNFVLYPVVALASVPE